MRGFKNMESIKIKEIESLVEESRLLESASDRFSEEHIRWVNKVKRFFRDNFGEESEYYGSFISFSWRNEEQVIIGGPARPRESMNPQLGIDRVNKEAYQRQIKASRGFLLATKDDFLMASAKREEMAENFLKKIKKAKDLCSEGVLKNTEFVDLKNEATQVFEELFSGDEDAVIYRKFHKLKNSPDWIYNDIPRAGSGGFIGIEKMKLFDEVEQMLKEKLLSLGSDMQEEEALILAGDFYYARKILRSILSKAQESIHIMDSYLDNIILQVIDTQAGFDENLEIRLLTTDKNKNKFQGLFSDLEAFKKQYPSRNIALKKATSIPHDRFIIIDKKTIFQSGHSVGMDLGSTTSRISKIGNKEDVEKINKEFEDSWNLALIP